MYLAAYYVRPQEWHWMLSSLRPVTIIMAFSIIALFLRDRGVQWRSILRSPHDWLMLLYFLYLAFFVEHDPESFAMVRNSFIIYFVTVLALTNFERLRLYVWWWAGCIGFVVLLALASRIGIDPLDAKYFTDSASKGRLALPLSVFDNPNALGHTLVPLLGMLYFFLIWRRPIFVKEVGFLLLILPALALYLTLSKGAYLAAFVAIVFGMTVGRPKVVQIIVLGLALTAGWAGVKQLPRMQELREPRREEGIQGRLIAWKFGLDKMDQQRHGVGLFAFGNTFLKENGYYKAPHSSYVEAGAEQGFMGLMFFVGVLYCSFRFLLTAKIDDVEEERMRRVLLVLLVSYVASSWLIGWGYKTFFYLTTACVSAFYRHLRERVVMQTEMIEPEQTVPTLVPAAAALPAGPGPLVTPALRTASGLDALALAPAPAVRSDDTEKKPLPKFWYRFGLLDLAMVYLCTHAVVRIWIYVLKHA